MPGPSVPAAGGKDAMPGPRAAPEDGKRVAGEGIVDKRENKGFNIGKVMDAAQTSEVPCQNCGRLVLVLLPFVGCVFCADCMMADSSWEANAPEFQERWLVKKEAVWSI